jgi:hypothetical protein
MPARPAPLLNLSAVLQPQCSPFPFDLADACKGRAHEKKAAAAPRKRVRFAATTKTWCGSSDTTKLMDTLIFAYFESQVIHAPADICRVRGLPAPLPVFCDVLRRMTALVKKVERAPSGSAPVGLYGGGSGHVVSTRHLPHLRRLQTFLVRMAARLVQPGAADEADGADGGDVA